MSTMEQQQQVIQQLQQQLEQMSAAMQQHAEEIKQGVGSSGGQAPMMQPKNMLPDGSQVGGREGNYISPRPNGI
jgi:methyl-accepting chemotaxis protein